MAKSKRKPTRAPQRELYDTGAAVLRQVSQEGELLMLREADGALFEIRNRAWRDGRSSPAKRVQSDPLDYYKAQRMLTGRQWQAGRRLGRAYFTAGLLAVPMVNYEAVHGVTTGLNPDRYIRNVAAWEAYKGAMQAINRVGQIYLRQVCCWGQWATEVATGLGTPKRYGLERLKEALDDLSEYYEAHDKGWL